MNRSKITWSNFIKTNYNISLTQRKERERFQKFIKSIKPKEKK